MTNLFVCSPTVQPSERWLAAFPDGVRGGVADVSTAARPHDVVWVASAHHGWAALIAGFGRALPQSPIVVVTMAPEADEAVLALERGARGYCHALAVPSLLREVSLVAQHGGLWVGPELMARVVDAAGRTLSGGAERALPDNLSPREAEVAREAARGFTNKEIAAKLGITDRTVKAHLGAVFEKLGVRDRLQLVLRISAPNDVTTADDDFHQA